MRAGLVEQTVHEVLIAVGEATTNALEHAGAPVEQVGQGAIRVHAELVQGVLRVTVSDRGSWRERGGDLDIVPNRGRGLLLMTGLMDRVEIRSGPRGTTVELIKELHSPVAPEFRPPPMELHHDPVVALV